MARLTPPALDPGPRKQLSDELHSLHRRAGWPSVRELSRGLGIGVASSSRIHDAFTKARLPTWGLLELLVVELAGRAPDIDPREEMKRFHRLWDTAAAETATEGEEPPRTREIYVNSTPQHDPRPFKPLAAWAVRPATRQAQPNEASKLPVEIKQVLVDTLADLYRTHRQAEELLEDLAFPPHTRPPWGTAGQDVVTFWRQVVRALELGAMQRDGVLQLVETTLRTWPGNHDLQKVMEFLRVGQRKRDGVGGSADTLYRTVEFVGSEAYPDFLRLVCELVDPGAVQLYANHQQAAFRVAEMPQDRLQQLQERAARIDPGVEVLYGEHDFHPALYTRLRVVGPDRQLYEIHSVPNTTLPSELVPAVWAEYRPEAFRDANGQPRRAIVDYRDENGEIRRLNLDVPLFNQGIPDGGQLEVSAEWP